ncbi:MAG: Histone deacetylase [Candidatus Saccharibacteria bacterium]|nr:Histone deacetylase [Candidatus Saccharibacteria bacterium]
MRAVELFYDPRHAIHNPAYELYNGIQTPYAECADRLEVIAEHLQQSGRKLRRPRSYDISHVRALHSAPYINFVRETSARLKNGETLMPSNFIMDTYTPITGRTYQAARQAVSTALTAAHYVLSNHDGMAYALCRPPGHHAAQKHSGGYCYFNNAAIAANYLSGHGRIAILDIDYHHGNGTQELFYDRDDVLYVSIHADPSLQFPYISGFKSETGEGRGKGFTKNYPLPLHTGNAQYFRTLRRAVQDVQNFNPDFLVISAGFDAHEADPICRFDLTTSCYADIGSTISALNLPTIIVQEGGYNLKTLGILAETFINCLEK